MRANPPLQIALTARGHPNIRASHSSTFEVTTESKLTLKGDCIIGVTASLSASDINTILGDLLRKSTSYVHTVLSVGDITDHVNGRGSPYLSLTSPQSLVWRTSDFVDERTVAIHCNKAARDLDRNLIRALQNPENHLQVTLLVFEGTTSRSNTL